jgi:hypothetical protein
MCCGEGREAKCFALVCYMDWRFGARGGHYPSKRTGSLVGTPYDFPVAETHRNGCRWSKVDRETAYENSLEYVCRFIGYLPYAGGQRGKNDAGLFSYSAAQCGVDAGLPARSGILEGREEIGVDAQADECFAGGCWWSGGGWRRWLWFGRLRRSRSRRCWGWLRGWLDKGGESGILWRIFEDHFRAPGEVTTVATIPCL